MTHTSGLGYWFWNADLVKYEQVTGAPERRTRLDWPPSRRPLMADPGTRFEYGINTDWLGRVVEAVAGKTLDVVIKEGITGPLGMDDTMFPLDDAALRRTRHRARARARTALGLGRRTSSTRRPDWWAGGHGLYSTPRDYIRFERALLRGGELDGERILRRRRSTPPSPTRSATCDFPAEIPTADPPITDTFNAGPGWKWGYGLLLNTSDIPGAPPRRHRRLGGAVQHPLLHRPHDRDLRVDLHQLAAVHHAHEAWKLYGDFEEALYAAL